MIKSLWCILFEKYFYFLTLEMASPGNQHCASCIGALSFPMWISIQCAVIQISLPLMADGNSMMFIFFAVFVVCLHVLLVCLSVCLNTVNRLPFSPIHSGLFPVPTAVYFEFYSYSETGWLGSPYAGLKQKGLGSNCSRDAVG